MAIEVCVANLAIPETMGASTEAFRWFAVGVLGAKWEWHPTKWDIVLATCGLWAPDEGHNVAAYHQGFVNETSFGKVKGARQKLVYAALPYGPDSVDRIAQFAQVEPKLDIVVYPEQSEVMDRSKFNKVLVQPAEDLVRFIGSGLPKDLHDWYARNNVGVAWDELHTTQLGPDENNMKYQYDLWNALSEFTYEIHYNAGRKDMNRAYGQRSRFKIPITKLIAETAGQLQRVTMETDSPYFWRLEKHARKLHDILKG